MIKVAVITLMMMVYLKKLKDRGFLCVVGMAGLT